MLTSFAQTHLIAYLSKMLTEIPKKSIVKFVKKDYLSDLAEHDAKLYELLSLKEQALHPSQMLYKALLYTIQRCKKNILSLSPDIS